MSRSRKKSIVKDRGHRKDDYWRVHRRVNKQLLKHAHTSQFEFKYVDGHYEGFDFNEGDYDPVDFVVYSWTYKECYDFYMRNLKVIDIGDLEITFRHPKELVNDYDYRDWTFDAEYGNWNNYEWLIRCKKEWARK